MPVPHVVLFVSKPLYFCCSAVHSSLGVDLGAWTVE